MLPAVIIGLQQPRRSLWSRRCSMRRLLFANLRRMIAFTRNPSVCSVSEKVDTLWNTGKRRGISILPRFFQKKAATFACSRANEAPPQTDEACLGVWSIEKAPVDL